MNKRLFAPTLLLLAMVACGGGGSDKKTDPIPPPVPAALTPTITAANTAIKGQSYQATTPAQTNCTFTWGITGGTITNGQTTPNLTFTADVAGNLVLTCIATNSANAHSGTAYYNITVTDPPPPQPTVFPGIFRNLKSQTSIQGSAQFASTSGTLTMSSVRANHTASPLQDGRVVIMGGTASGGNPVTIDIFDPTTERFTVANAQLLQARIDHSAVPLDDNRIAILGGGVPTVDVYDPTLDTMTTVMSFEAQRNKAKAINIGGNRILVYGGQDASEYFSPTIIDTLTWTKRVISTDATHKRVLFAIETLKSGKVLISGGSLGEGINSLGATNTIISFDPTTETFTTIGTMLRNRVGHSMLELPNGTIGLYGGFDGNTIQKSTETLDLTTNTCTVGGDMIGGKVSMLSAYLQNGFTLHAGGRDDTGFVVNTQMIYDPSTLASGYTNSMLTSRTDFTLTVMPNGCYLITGGRNAGIEWDSAEVFDPQASVSITYPYSTMPNSDTIQLTASGDVEGLVWTCDVGSVSQTGLYTSPAQTNPAAIAYITATNSKGKSAIIHMLFLKGIVSIVGPDTIKAATPTTYTAEVKHYTDKTVTWSSNVGVVDAVTGVLTPTGVSNGDTIYLTATSVANPSLSVTRMIVVVP